MSRARSGAGHIDRDGKADGGDVDDADGYEGGVAEKVTHGDWPQGFGVAVDFG